METLPYVAREADAKPTTPRVAQAFDRYLESPLVIDVEYLRHLTARHREVSHWEEQERRAECHAWALERLTPVIHPGELVVGGKTRFVRGAVPYANYAAEYLHRELRNEQQAAQDAVTDLGTGGGIALSQQMAGQSGWEKLCHRFLIPADDKAELERCVEYWRERCMQTEGDRLWKTHYPHAAFIEKGWDMVLYTAPHDPAPEGRFILDFDTALGKGLRHCVARCHALLDEAFRHPGDIESLSRVHFWRAAIRVLEATMQWGHRYGERARDMAAAESDPARRAELERISDHCLRFGEVPRSFAEAVQHFWLLYVAGHLEGAHLGYSVGRFDRYMYPFYRADLERGGTTREACLEYLQLLRVKHTEMEYVASFSWEGLGSGNLFQNCILGGCDENGQAADNALSILVLEAAIHMPTTQPTLSIWWTPALSAAFLLKAAECVKTGVGFPAWFNLDVYVKHELQRNPQLGLGFIRKHAAMGGCTEPVLEGCSYGVVQAGFINHVKLLELSLCGGRDPRTGIVLEELPLPTTARELTDTWRALMARAVRYWQEYWNVVMEAHARTVPLIFCSALMRDCIERGRNLDRGGALNNATPTTLSSGLVNVANALVAVESAEARGISLAAVRAAVAVDFVGHEAVREALLAAPKWGNDDDRVDAVMRDLWNTYCDVVEGGTTYLGRPYDPSMLAISTPAPFGKACGATPDGRRAGEPIADGVTSPHPGTDVEGPTAVLRSVQKLDHTRIRGGLHNMKFHPDALRGTDGSWKLIHLVRTMFETQTAFQIQFNVVDSRMLRDAQAHPEKYRDLIVRVAGFSAFFVELQKSVQDQVIERTEYNA